MTCSLFCTSHSPLAFCFAREPEAWDDIKRVLVERKAAVEAFDPELVFAFGSDHFNGFFLKLMPAFCVGGAATAVGDIGGFAGSLDVPHDTALACVEFLRESGVDPAVSYAMTLDHAFSQTLTGLLGGLDVYPTIPVFINCITMPFVPFKRTRLLGEAIGAFAKSLNRRVLFVASGGMSHHPTRYYPVYGTGDAAVTAWQLSGGGNEQSLTQAQWLERLQVMHLEAAEMIVRGERTAKHMRINPVIDQRFLDVLTANKLEDFDTWDQSQMVEEAGIGFMELQTWIAAAAAHRAAGGGAPVLDIYAVTEEIGIGSGVVHAS